MSNALASELFIRNTPVDSGLFAAVNCATMFLISRRTASASTPTLAIGVRPFVIDAGLTFATAVFAGSIKSMSSRVAIAFAIHRGSKHPALGLLSRSNSIVATAILATFKGASSVLVVSNRVTGLPLPSPTHQAAAARLRQQWRAEGNTPQRRNPAGPELAEVVIGRRFDEVGHAASIADQRTQICGMCRSCCGNRPRVTISFNMTSSG
jgi:hypothetical protein